MRVLVLAAHPDDETLGCGATIAKMSDEGHEIKLLTFTDGVGSRDDSSAENRNNRLEKISKVLGITHYNSGVFPDNQLDTIPLLQLCKFIETETEDFSPDIIFTHHPDCLNIDHQLVYRATITAFRPQYGKNIDIYSYYVPSSTDYNPLKTYQANSYFSIEQFVDKKIQALKLYDEEMRQPPHSRSYENVKNLMKVWGAEVGLAYAEKFQLIRSVKN